METFELPVGETKETLRDRCAENARKVLEITAEHPEALKIFGYKLITGTETRGYLFWSTTHPIYGLAKMHQGVQAYSIWPDHPAKNSNLRVLEMKWFLVDIRTGLLEKVAAQTQLLRPSRVPSGELLRPVLSNHDQTPQEQLLRASQEC